MRVRERAARRAGAGAAARAGGARSGERPSTGSISAGKARKQGLGKPGPPRGMLGGWPRWSQSLGKDRVWGVDSERAGVGGGTLGPLHLRSRRSPGGSSRPAPSIQEFY